MRTYNKGRRSSCLAQTTWYELPKKIIVIDFSIDSMKLVFILPTLKSPYNASPEPPLGLAYLAASLLDYKNDLQIEIIDGFLLKRREYQKKISNINADIIGVSTTMAQLSEALMIPSIVKRKKARFIIGGPGVENLPRNRFYESGYSIVCYGEGERTIVELVAAIENGLSLEGVKGISYLDKGREISQNQHTEFVIHDRHGRIREKDSHGHDSYPPRG